MPEELEYKEPMTVQTNWQIEEDIFNRVKADAAREGRFIYRHINFILRDYFAAKDAELQSVVGLPIRNKPESFAVTEFGASQIRSKNPSKC